MDNYKKMHFHLFNKITTIMNDLQEVQQQVEEMYTKQQEPTIKVIHLPQKENN